MKNHPVYMYKDKSGKVLTSSFSPQAKTGINIGLYLLDVIAKKTGITQKDNFLPVFGFEDQEYIGQITMQPKEKQIEDGNKSLGQ